ncbi:hypothetical protein ACFCZ1_21900 [Streptomyces sp. NPDC056224]|uniref:hypothetical protein n=1 Tax=Streptomyces sp. NPDC056224 TaxID=3345750 RepID=UPI0035E2F386
MQYTNLPPIKVRMRLTFRDRNVEKLLAMPPTPPAAHPAAAEVGRRDAALNAPL